MLKRFLRGLGNPNPCFLLMGMLVLSLGLSRLSPYFWTGRNIANIIDQASVGIILSMGMTFVVAAAGIDLSTGANIALSSLVAALFLKQGFGCLPSIFAGLLLASTSGGLNGCLISFLHLNPFIVTLCTMSVFRGAALLLTDGRPVFGFPESFMSLGSVLPGGVSAPALTALSVAGLGMFLMRFTKFGAYACFMGCNEEALSRSGVNCHRWKLAFYAVSGLCSGIAGLILCARLNTAEPLSAVGIEMDVIAAVVLGGTDIRGGRGSAVGSLLACLFLALLRNGFVIVNVSARYQQLLMGLIVLVAVSVLPLTEQNLLLGVVEANGSGVKVVTVGNGVNREALGKLGGHVDIHVTTDFRMQGELGAQYIIGRTGGRGKVAVIEGIPGATQSEARKNGAVEAFKKAGMNLLAVQAANFNRRQAYDLTAALADANPDLAGIACGNDIMALGAVEALKKKGMKDKVVVVGVDFIEEAKASIERGELDATVAMSPYLLGKVGTILSLKALRGGTFGEDVVRTPIKLVDRENVASMEGWR